MVRLTPPPASVQDRAVFDYLYQLQEYLGVEFQRLGVGAAAVETGSDMGTVLATAGRTSGEFVADIGEWRVRNDPVETGLTFKWIGG